MAISFHDIYEYFVGKVAFKGSRLLKVHAKHKISYFEKFWEFLDRI